MDTETSLALVSSLVIGDFWNVYVPILIPMLYDKHKNYFINFIIRSKTRKLFLRTKLTKSNTAKAAASAQDGFRSSLASF